MCSIHFKLLPIFFPHCESLSYRQLYFHLASSLLQSSFQHLSLTHLSLVQLSSVWFSAGSQWDLFYVQQPAKVQSHLIKCQIVCVFPDPLIHRTAAHLVCLLIRQKYSMSDRSVYSPAPCCLRPVLGNDGWTPPHHRQVVCTH